MNSAGNKRRTLASFVAFIHIKKELVRKTSHTLNRKYAVSFMLHGHMTTVRSGGNMLLQYSINVNKTLACTVIKYYL